MKNDITNQQLSSSQLLINNLFNYLKSYIIGQDDLVRDLLITLLSGGHILIEGLPGLGKTKSANSLAKAIKASFKRIQFTPDLLPSDIIGTDIFINTNNSFQFTKGPLFANIILADEINRAPAKVQSALLEAMSEKQITVRNNSYILPDLFFVMATKNPIEQEGTYNLPEAQLDRFLLYVNVDFPDKKNELLILDQFANEDYSEARNTQFNIEVNDILQMRHDVRNIYMDEKLKEYIVNLVLATRKPEIYDSELKDYILHGASPRASSSLFIAAKSLAFIEGSDYVKPQHIQDVAANVLAHRITLNFNALAKNISARDIINRLLNLVAV
jgi:MoxR-like ATPase